MFFSSRGFHSSTQAMGRFPALPTRISRQAHQKNLARIQKLKESLGSKYKVIGRDKRISPITERDSPSKPTQPPPPPKWKRQISKFLISTSQPNALPFEPKQIGKVAEGYQKVSQISTPLEKKEKTQKSLLMPTKDAFQKQVIETDADTILEMPKDAIPPSTLKDELFEYKTQAGPYYKYSLSPSEAKFLLESTPAVSKEAYPTKKDESGQQSEMMRRLISMENSNSQSTRQWNVSRMIEMFQKHSLDTGSPQVQGKFLLEILTIPRYF